MCSRCGKPGHVKKFFGVRICGEDANVTDEVEESGDINWEQCFSIEVIDHQQPTYMVSGFLL